MEYKCLIFERENGIGMVTVNRPETGNVMNREAWLEIEDAIEQSDKDEEIMTNDAAFRSCIWPTTCGWFEFWYQETVCE